MSLHFGTVWAGFVNNSSSSHINNSSRSNQWQQQRKHALCGNCDLRYQNPEYQEVGVAIFAELKGVSHLALQ